MVAEQAPTNQEFENGLLITHSSESAHSDQKLTLRRFFVRRQKFFLGFFGVAVVLIGWQTFAVNRIVNPIFTSYPTQIYHEGIFYFAHGTGWRDLGVTSKEFAVGFIVSLVIGVPTGIAFGWYKWLDALTRPVVGFFYNSPRIALAPLMVIWFGLGSVSKIAIVFIVAVFPILMNAQSGVEEIDPSLIAMARSFGASDLKILRSIVIPGSVVPISSGIRIGIGQALAGVVLAEFIASVAGLGYTTEQASTQLNTALMMDAVFVIAIMGVILAAVFRRLENYLKRWRV
jgi:ABC-type nitrate/sulfonate/bicarbonate transport system permease component